MINLSTSSDELWRVLPEEHDKAVYWMKKHFGGEKSYEKMRDELLRRCVSESKPLISEIIDYTSKEGNHWVVFEQSTYYPESMGSFCMPVAMCYYETAASLGVFSIGYTHINGVDRANSIIIYTPHFFQRYAERMNIEGGPRDILVKYLEMANSFSISPMPSDDGQKKIIIRIPGCTCHGIMREDGRDVYEVRTILTDEQLSYKQSRETKKVREMGDAMRFEPRDMRVARLKNSDDAFEDYCQEMEHLESLGIDTTGAQKGMILTGLIGELFHKMGLIDRMDDDFRDYFSRQAKMPIHYFLNRESEQGDQFDHRTEFVKLAREIAARIGIRKFNWREFQRLAFCEE